MKAFWRNYTLASGLTSEEKRQAGLREFCCWRYHPENHPIDRTPLIVNEKDGSILAWVPPGEFWRGMNLYGPKYRGYSDGYYLGVQCITNRQYHRFVEKTGHRPPDKADGKTPIWQGRSYPAEYGEHPVVCVSWEDAQAYCTWAGLTLPTEAHWERGARGPGNLSYPWGDNWDVNKCRHDENRGNATTCPVFAYPQGVSGFGTMNQSGNVWEWCQDWWSEDSYRKSPQPNPEGPSSGWARVIRGGGWSYSYVKGFRAYYRHYGAPADRRVNLGFRPCLPPGQQQG